MLTLLTFPAGFGQASFSPFCVKAHYMLDASGQAWQREDLNDPRKMPHAKLPVLRTPAGLIHDSENIRLYLEENGADFTAGLSPADQAASHAFVRMAEEHMYFVQVLDRWERDEVWHVLRDAYFHIIPRPVRRLVTSKLRRKLLAGMNAQGLGRMSWAERMARLELDLTAITQRLSETPFLFADHPTLADFSVGPILGAMRATPVETLLTQRIIGDPLLSGYVDRLDALILGTCQSRTHPQTSNPSSMPRQQRSEMA